MFTYITMQNADYKLGKGTSVNVIAKAEENNDTNGAMDINIFVGKGLFASVSARRRHSENTVVEFHEFDSAYQIESVIADHKTARIILCSDAELKSDAVKSLRANVQRAASQGFNQKLMLTVADLINKVRETTHSYNNTIYLSNNSLDISWYDHGNKSFEMAQITFVGENMYQRDKISKSFGKVLITGGYEFLNITRHLLSYSMRRRINNHLAELVGHELRIPSHVVAIPTGRSSLLVIRLTDDKMSVKTVEYLGNKPAIKIFCAEYRVMSKAERKAKKKAEKAKELKKIEKKAEEKAKKKLAKAAKSQAKKKSLLDTNERVLTIALGDGMISKKDFKKALKKLKKRDAKEKKNASAKEFIGGVITGGVNDAEVISVAEFHKYMLESPVTSVDCEEQTAADYLRSMTCVGNTELPEPSVEADTDGDTSVKPFGDLKSSKHILATPPTSGVVHFINEEEAAKLAEVRKEERIEEDVEKLATVEAEANEELAEAKAKQTSEVDNNGTKEE